MTKHGMQIAREYSNKLPSFEDEISAKKYFFALRDARLRKIHEIASRTNLFVPNFTMESLKGLEVWYFQLYESNGFTNIGISKDEFLECMAIYAKEVIVKTYQDAQWIVEKNFIDSNKYEFGVTRRNVTMFGIKDFNRELMKNNKRRESLYREYFRYFSD